MDLGERERKKKEEGVCRSDIYFEATERDECWQRTKSACSTYKYLEMAYDWVDTHVMWRESEI